MCELGLAHRAQLAYTRPPQDARQAAEGNKGLYEIAARASICTSTINYQALPEARRSPDPTTNFPRHPFTCESSSICRNKRTRTCERRTGPARPRWWHPALRSTRGTGRIPCHPTQSCVPSPCWSSPSSSRLHAAAAKSATNQTGSYSIRAHVRKRTRAKGLVSYLTVEVHTVGMLASTTYPSSEKELQLPKSRCGAARLAGCK